MLVIVLSTLISVAIIILLIDIIPISKDWLSRIHIGRYANASEWRESITATGSKWLNRTPKMKVTDHTRLVIIDILQGNYTKTAIQQWQEAAILLGLSEMKKVEQLSQKGIQQKVEAYFHTKLDATGAWRVKPKHVDVGILAYSMMKLGGEDDGRYRAALDEVWALIQSHIGTDGTVQYRKHMPHYRYVDTIGFICPFLVAYGLRYNKEECVNLAVRQLVAYDEHGMLENYYIPSHAYHVESGIPAGLFGWGRGLGWFAIGLIDSWLELPNTHQHKQVLEKMVRKFAQAALNFQLASGCWNWSVNREEARADSSTTATLGWFLSQAALIPELEEACLKGAKLAEGYLMQVTRRSGAIDFSQGDTKDIGVYSTLFNIMPFTQGFTMRMSYAQVGTSHES